MPCQEKDEWLACAGGGVCSEGTCVDDDGCGGASHRDGTDGFCDIDGTLTGELGVCVELCDTSLPSPPGGPPRAFYRGLKARGDCGSSAA